MISEVILCKYGEIILKGANKQTFESALIKELRRRASRHGTFKIYFSQSTIYIEPQDECADIDGMYDSARKVFSQDNVTEDDIANIRSGFVALFDDLLGDGATADIFGKRPISFYDCYDIFHYITSEIKAFSADKRKGMQDG